MKTCGPEQSGGDRVWTMSDRDAKRRRNECRFDRWEALPNGGRRYTLRVTGRGSGYVEYVKDVDGNERTTRFVQYVYTPTGQCIGKHQKFPNDTGHQNVSQEQV